MLCSAEGLFTERAVRAPTNEVPIKMNKELVPTDDEDLSPVLAACLPKERLFIDALLQGKSGAQAAREAGYGVDGSTAETMARIAHRTLGRSRVIDALAEQSRKMIRSLAPSAIQAVKDILTTTTHKDRAKVALNLIERIDPTVQRVDAHVTHEIVDHRRDAIEQLRSLKALGVAREKLEELFGFTGLPMLEKQLADQDAKTIDAEFTEVPEPDVDAAIMENL
jgi:phage terminase small subunit